MLRKKKFSYYFAHMLVMSTVNKVRLVLASVGIFVAVFLFSVGVIIANSYYNGKLRIIDDMSNNSVIISSNMPARRIKEVASKYTSIIPIEDLVLSQEKPILSAEVSKNQYLNVMARVHGVSGSEELLPIINEDGLFLPIKPMLIEGRYFGKEELSMNAPAAIVDEFTAKLLFPDGDCLGKQFEIDSGISGSTTAKDNDEERRSPIRFTIVGIIKNSYISESKKLRLKKDIVNSTNTIFVNTNIYCPLSTFSHFFPQEESETKILYYFNEENECQDFVTRMMALSDISRKEGEVLIITTKDMLLNNCMEQLLYTKTLLNIIIIILCIISGISIMSITFFSVKERIPEIGIRKAFGASKTDIVFQFMFEMVVIAFIVSIFAVCSSYLCCKLAEEYLARNLFLSFKVQVSNAQLILPLLVGVTEAVTCSFIPSLYAASIKVTDSLKFE